MLPDINDLLSRQLLLMGKEMASTSSSDQRFNRWGHFGGDKGIGGNCWGHFKGDKELHGRWISHQVHWREQTGPQ